MGCNNLMTEEYDKLIEAAMRGETCFLDPEIEKELMPEVEKILQEKAAEIAKLETPREERAMRLIESSVSGDKESLTQKNDKNVETYKAFGVCPIKVSGFGSSWLGSNENIINVLNKLPQIGLLTFEEARYTGKIDATKDSEGRIGIVLGEATPEKNGRVPIKIGEHHPDFFKEEYPELERLTSQEREQKMKQIEIETFVHEYAEGVWRELTTLEERAQWRELHFQTIWEKREFVSGRASDSPKEDFGECCAKFIAEPETLKQNNERKYSFVNDFLSQLEEESRWLAERFSN